MIVKRIINVHTDYYNDFMNRIYEHNLTDHNIFYTKILDVSKEPIWKLEISSTDKNMEDLINDLKDNEKVQID